MTRFDFTLHPIGPIVLAGMLLYPAPMAADVLRNFRDVMADAPDEVGAGVALVTAPDGQPGGRRDRLLRGIGRGR